MRTLTAIALVTAFVSLESAPVRAQGYIVYYEYPQPMTYSMSYSPPMSYTTSYSPQISYSTSYSPPMSYSPQISYSTSYSPPMSYTTSYSPPICNGRRLRYAPSTPSYSQGDARRSSTTAAKPPTPTTMVSVGAYDNYFEPKTIHVQPGTTVRWMNKGHHGHTVTANDESWDSGDLAPGTAYSATFRHPGTYHYYCRHHAADKMQGAIVVG